MKPPAKHPFATVGTLAITAGLLASTLAGPYAGASSHRDSPLVGEDPAADNTDVYAFRSYETGREGYVTLLSNFFPLQEPINGPNYYRLSDYVTYDINVDTNGDAQADLTYRFNFTSTVVDELTFYYNTGVIGPPPNPSDPASQYANLNQRQGYTLREIIRGNGNNGNNGNRDDDDDGNNGNGNGQGQILLRNARTAPYRVGPKSLNPRPEQPRNLPAQGDTTQAYQNLAQLAVHTAPNSGGLRAFVGPRDEGFYVELGTAFDLINPRAPGVDGVSGFNITTVAVEIPLARFRAAGDTDGIIGVWSTASRRLLPVCDANGSPTAPCNIRGVGGGGNGGGGGGDDDDDNGRAANGRSVQVSRLANPLFNEFLNPLRVKDRYNASVPATDAGRREFIVNPGTSQSTNAFIPRLRDLTTCTDLTNRRDQEASWLLGYPAGVVNGFPGNRETQTARPAVAEMMRLNYNIPPRPFGPTQDRRGVLGNDFAGMPNGRRVGDDSVDILLRLWGGELQDRFGGNPCPVAAQLVDNIPANDVSSTLGEFLPFFPYLALPHDGFNHVHDHSEP